MNRQQDAELAPTFEAHLCDNGVTTDGWPCTGSVHAGSVLVRCTDDSHRVSGYITTMPERPVDWPAVAARLAGKLGEAQTIVRHWQDVAGRIDRDLEDAIAERAAIRHALPREMPVEFEGERFTPTSTKAGEGR